MSFWLKDQDLIHQRSNLRNFLRLSPIRPFLTFAAMAELFDFDLVASAEDAETAQIAADQDEMVLWAEFVIPADKTTADLERDLEAMVSGVNTLSLQASSSCRWANATSWPSRSQSSPTTKGMSSVS